MPGGFPLGPDLCNANDQGTVTASSRGTSVTCGNSAYGSYVQLVASTPNDTCAMLVSVQTIANSNSEFMEAARIAVGGAGSEVVLIPDLTLTAPSSGYYAENYFFPVNIPAGTRISAAGYCIGATDTIFVSVILFDGGFTNMEGAAGVDSIGWASGKGTNVTGGAAHTKGNFAQLTGVGGTVRDYIGFVVGFDNNNAALSTTNDNILFDIAIGAGGSEQIIIPNYPVGPPQSSSSAGVFMTGDPSPFFPIAIPAGTRIAARVQSIVASQTFGVTLYGVYQ